MTNQQFIVKHLIETTGRVNEKEFLDIAQEVMEAAADEEVYFLLADPVTTESKEIIVELLHLAF